MEEFLKCKKEAATPPMENLTSSLPMRVPLNPNDNIRCRTSDINPSSFSSSSEHQLRLSETSVVTPPMENLAISLPMRVPLNHDNDILLPTSDINPSSSSSSSEHQSRLSETSAPTPPMTNLTNFLPMRVPLNPGHDILSSQPLDLRVRKNSVSPDYPHDYKNKNQSIYIDSSLPNSSPRPFKAYPKVPMPIPLIGTSNMDSTKLYEEFRQKMLVQVQSTHNGSNKNMRRRQSQNSQITDPEYREKRKKNNEACKRSRKARRAKADEIAIRCSFLKQENLRLKVQNEALKQELLHFKTIRW